MINKAAAALLASFVLVGCAGKVEFIRPISAKSTTNVKLIPRARDAVWNAAVPALGKQFFVINNLDKSSGLINISYTGDPERYVDCGEISSYVQNVRGERTYRFAGASENQIYEVMNNSGLFFISRRMKLEGRVNLVFEEAGVNQTRVSANTRYVLTRDVKIRNTQNQTANRSDTISFNSGSGASYPKGNDGQGVECVSKGTMEQEILSLID